MPRANPDYSLALEAGLIQEVQMPIGAKLLTETTDDHLLYGLIIVLRTDDYRAKLLTFCTLAP